VGKFVGKNSRAATILSLGIERRTASDPVPAAHGIGTAGAIAASRTRLWLALG
jgi:hypothetical protein